MALLQQHGNDKAHRPACRPEMRGIPARVKDPEGTGIPDVSGVTSTAAAYLADKRKVIQEG